MISRILVFEGLSLFLFPRASWVQRGLIEPNAIDGRHHVTYHHWASRGPVVAFDAKKIIVVSHSMGGPTSLWWCNQYPKLQIDLLLTLDPRPLHRPYVKPANVRRAVNFYQTGFMRGYEIEGATNFNVTGYASHTGLPALKEAREILLEAL